MEWTKFPFVKISLFYSIGILSAYYKVIPLYILYSGLALSLAIFLALHFLYKKPKIKPFKGLMLLFFIYCSGGIILHSHHPHFQQDHFRNKQFEFYSAIVSSVPIPYSQGYKAVLDVQYIKTKNGWETATGNVIAYFKSSVPYKIGTELNLKGSPKANDKQRNPEAFDYSKYLFHKGITHTHFPAVNEINIISTKNTFPIRQMAADISLWYESIINKHIKGSKEKGLVIGLVLGSKSQLDPELKKSYEYTGLAHILAVSGFHVALIYQIISWLLFFMNKYKYGKKVFPWLVIAFLFFYAVITGLTPPVVRATTMFTVLLLGKSFRKSLPPLHTLFLSAFLILLFDPFSLFDVGFQLSVVAVLSIVLFYQFISDFLKFSNFILTKFWELIALTLAAQILTLPLILYYFHNFPVYFIPANLISIWPSSLIIYSSLALVFTSFIPYVGDFNGYVTEILCRGLNDSVEFLAGLPSPFPTGIYFSDAQMCIFTIALFTLIFAIYYRTANLLYISGILILSLSILTSIDYHQIARQKSWIVFHIPKHTISAFVSGRNAVIFSDIALDENNKDFNFNCKNYLLSKGIDSLKFMEIKKNYKVAIDKAEFMIADYPVNLKTLIPKNIIITNLKSKHYNKLGNYTKHQIILDGSIKEESIKKLNLRAYSTWKSGAFISEF